MAGSLLGTEVQRVEDPDLLRGRGTYIGNLQLDGMLHIGFVRSPLAHAKIVSVDGNRISSPEALQSALGGHHPGDSVTIGWANAVGQTQSATVVLATGPAA